MLYHFTISPIFLGLSILNTFPQHHLKTDFERAHKQKTDVYLRAPHHAAHVQYSLSLLYHHELMMQHSLSTSSIAVHHYYTFMNSHSPDVVPPRYTPTSSSSVYCIYKSVSACIEPSLRECIAYHHQFIITITIIIIKTRSGNEFPHLLVCLPG